MGRPTSAGPTIMEMIPTITAIATSARSASTTATGRFRSFPAAAATRLRPLRRPSCGTEPGPTNRSPSRHAVVGQLGAGRRCRERNQGLPLRHRHDAGRHGRCRLDAACQRAGSDEDGIEPDHGANLLFQRQGRQRRGTGGPRRDVQGAEGGDRHDPAQRPGGGAGRRHARDLGNRLRFNPFHHGVVVQLSTRPPTPRAASKATSTPSARRRAARTPWLGRPVLPAMPT